jgi:hypothetical protein
VIKLKGKKIIIIALVIVAAGVAWYFLKGGNGAGVGSLTQKFSEKSPFTGSLKAAVALGVPMKCTYTENGNEYSGIIKGKMYKGNIVMQDGTEGTVLMKDDCVYTWSDIEKQGTKFCFDSEDFEDTGDVGESEDADMWDQSGEDNPIDYVCYPTVVTNAEFNLPSGIEFMDLGAMMNNTDFSY